jgi:hypothetical protein
MPPACNSSAACSPAAAALALPASRWARSLFLSANEADVRAALAAGVPAGAGAAAAAAGAGEQHPQEVRIAFDGDAVLFSDEAEQRLPARQGLAAFQQHEQAQPCHAAAARALQAAAAGAAPVARRQRRRCVRHAGAHRAGDRAQRARP